MENIITQLHEDHGHWTRILAVIDAEIAKLMADETPDFEILEDAMRYMTYYPDVVHHPKEDALFDKLKSRDPEISEVVEKVRREHVSLAEKSQQFFEIVKKTNSNEFSSKYEMIEKGRDYVRTLRTHVNQEEGGLFKAAVRLLNEDDLNEVQAAYDAYHDPLFGAEVEEKYRELYDYITRS